MKLDLRILLALAVTDIFGSGPQVRMDLGQDAAMNAFAFVAPAAEEEAAQARPCFRGETGESRAAQA